MKAPYATYIKYGRPHYVFFGKIEISFDRWPWHKIGAHWSHKEKPDQKYGWGKVSGMARFGGGWDWKLGITIGGSTIMLDLIWGMVRFSKYRPTTTDSLLTPPWWMARFFK